MIDRDTIIRMFHEAGESAGWKPGIGNQLVINYLTHFAALVAAAEREDCKHECFDTVREAVHVAVEAEREACAQVCDEQASRSETSMLKAKSVKTRDIYSAAGQTAHWMAQAIRARSINDQT
jgi:hypothetical protein